MARNNCIPDNLLPEIMKMMSEGYNATGVQEWLKAKHDIICTAWTVSRRVGELKKVEQEARKNAIAEAAARDALNCVNIIDDRIVQMNTIATDLLKAKDNSDKMVGKQIADTLLKYIDKKMSLTGMDKTTTQETDEIVSGLLAKLGQPVNNDEE